MTVDAAGIPAVISHQPRLRRTAAVFSRPSSPTTTGCRLGDRGDGRRNRARLHGARGRAGGLLTYGAPRAPCSPHADLAIVYTLLPVGPAVGGRSGEVNDLVLTLVAGADRDAGRDAKLAAAPSTISGVSATVSTRDDADAVPVLYEDIDNDQRSGTPCRYSSCFAAALAAFNLINRIVEAQRREIGIGMALGVPRPRLAIRPLLIGVQVGVLGTIAGLGVGILIGNALRDLLESFLPLPNYVTPFQFGVFMRGAALGLLPPCWPRPCRSGGPCGSNRSRRFAPVTSPRRPAGSARGLDGLAYPDRVSSRCRCATCCGYRGASPSPRSASARRSPPSWPYWRCSTVSTRRSTGADRGHQGRRRSGHHHPRHLLPDRLTGDCRDRVGVGDRHR